MNLFHLCNHIYCAYINVKGILLSGLLQNDSGIWIINCLLKGQLSCLHKHLERHLCFSHKVLNHNFVYFLPPLYEVSKNYLCSCDSMNRGIEGYGNRWKLWLSQIPKVTTKVTDTIEIWNYMSKPFVLFHCSIKGGRLLLRCGMFAIFSLEQNNILYLYGTFEFHLIQ